VGTGGQNFDPFSGKANFVVSQQNSKFGMLDVKITNVGSRLEGKYYTNDGDLFDQFNITKANVPPVANNQSVSVIKDTPKSLTLTAIDANNDPLTYSVVVPPSHAILSGGTGATRTYTPNTGYVGTDTFTFKANDGQNMNYGIWMTSTEKIRGGFETSSAADHFVTSANSFNDGQWHYAVITYDGSNVRLYIDGAQVATKSTSGASPETSGTKPVRIGANSRVTPPGNFFTGEVDEVRVWNNAKTAQQVIDAFVGSINTSGQVLYIPFGSDPPVANSQLVFVNKNVKQTITLTATDPSNDPLAYIIVTPPMNGTLSGTAPNLIYNPNLNHVGSDIFTFKANDGTLDSNIATISVTVQNGPPIATNQQVSVNKNAQQTITLTATDPNNNPLTYSIVTQPLHGTISPTIPGGPSRTYTPQAGYVGPDSFTFNANDGTADSNTATVSITIQDTTSCTTNLPISGVTASGNDGNVPSIVLDNNLATRWSSNGIGQFITADLGSTQNICSVDIAWYNGNARQYHFVIATSTDGTTFTNKFSGDSCGTTLNSEKYTIPATDAKYVRITVNGNTANNWASIAELDIFGSSFSLTSAYNFEPSLSLSGPE
jgi:hypothetical protein